MYACSERRENVNKRRGCIRCRSLVQISALDLDQGIDSHHTLSGRFNEQGVDVDA